MSQDDDTLPLGEAAASQAGGTIGRFVIVGALGSGGMGVVLSAHDPTLDRKVALKLLHPGMFGDEGRARLQREAQAMARVSHPNVATVYEVGTHGEQLFVAMELVDGQTLKEWLQKPRSESEILKMFIAAGRGLEAVHAAGLVHRDFKPDNVLVGGDGRPRVTDFGLVSLSGGVASAGASPVTLSNAGTPAFMAPEQCRGAATDARSDQFSYCVALWGALTGERPFADDAAAEARHAPPRPAKLPAWLYAILARGLALDPETRWPSMNALLHALSHDPLAARRLRVTGVAVAAMAGLAVVGVFRARAEVCRGASARLVGVWDDAVRARVRESFLATKLPYAEDTFQKVRARLDAYTRGWVDEHEESCRATRVEGRQSDSLMDLRVACLERRKETLGALTALWSKGVDAAALSKAIDAAGELPALADCADPKALTEKLPLPKDPKERARVEAVEKKLDGVRALVAADRWEKAKVDAEAARAEADATGFAAARADAALLLGRVQLRVEDSQAEASLTAAQSLAGAAHDDRLAAQALIDLVQHLAEGERSADRALLAAEIADGLVERAGGGDELRGRLAMARGQALLTKGKLDDAAKALEDARQKLSRSVGEEDIGTRDVVRHLAQLADGRGDFKGSIKLLEDELVRREARFGPEHPEVMPVLNDLGVAHDDANDYAGAVPYYRRALGIAEKAYGPESPKTASILNNLGAAEDQLGHYEEAGKMYERSIAIREKLLGPEHPSLEPPLGNLSQVRLSQGRLDEGLALARRALAIGEKVHGPEGTQITYALVAIGDILQRKDDYEGALAAYQRAWEIKKKVLGPEHEETLLIENSVGSMRCAQKKYAVALPLMRHASLAIGKALGDQQAYVARLNVDYGRCLTNAGQAAAALPILAHAIEVSEKAQEPAWSTADDHYAHGRALWLTGKKAEGTAEVKAAIEVLEKSPSYLARRSLDDARAWLASR